VRLVLPASVVLPQPPTFLKAVLAASDDFTSIDWGAPAFDAQREVVGVAPAPGRMRVQWIVERRSGGGASASTLAVDPPEFVDVLDQLAEQRFELATSNDALQRALAASALR